MKEILQNSRSKKSAETLIEAIIAISILMIILGPASALYVSSIRTVAANRNDLIAAALAEEGLEVMRNIRDSNWLKFSPKAVDCWNARFWDSNVNLDNCNNAGNKIAVGSYRLAINVTSNTNEYLKWSLEAFNPDNRLKLDENPNPACIGSPPAPGCHMHFITDTHLYNYQRGQDTGFNREIVIYYIELRDPPTGDDALQILSKVSYRTGASVREIKRTGILSRIQP